MFRNILSIASLLFLYMPAFTQPKTDKFLLNLLTKPGNNSINQVLESPDNYRLQIIYTQINRNKHNEPTFRNYFFHYDPDLYFNPASMVKMPLAFLALEKLTSLDVK